MYYTTISKYAREIRTVFIEKSTYKWTSTVQTHVIQGSAVLVAVILFSFKLGTNSNLHKRSRNELPMSPTT